MLGKWNNEHMTMSYLNGIPLNAVLARAGFRDYLHMIPRSTVEPPDELLACIFPGIEKMHEAKVEVCLHTIYACVTVAILFQAKHCWKYYTPYCSRCFMMLDANNHVREQWQLDVISTLICKPQLGAWYAGQQGPHQQG